MRSVLRFSTAMHVLAKILRRIYVSKLSATLVRSGREGCASTKKELRAVAILLASRGN